MLGNMAETWRALLAVQTHRHAVNEPTKVVRCLLIQLVFIPPQAKQRDRDTLH